MMKRTGLFSLLLTLTLTLHAQSFETATQAVQNMGIGWNLGNTLDACSSGQQGLESEIYWGQPYTKPELMLMLKKAGFGAMRIPVTWMNHMDSSGKVNAQWMARVHEVVDYVINAGMYCILNVHHDTGEGSSHWLHASMTNYNQNKAKYEYLWQQIANEFKDYDQRLLFESYNEMLDKYDSWCFATFKRSGGYNATDAADAYNAINSYAQSFVNTVRATGGNNAKRNLVVNTYGACNGYGTWNAHLKEPLTEMKMPNDPAGAGHIAFQIHAYPSIANLSSAKNEISQMFNDLNTYLVSKGGPVIVGEWGTSNVDANVPDYEADRAKYLEFVTYFVKKGKEKGAGLFYWMGISDNSDRSLPAFTQPDAAEAMLKAYYGNDYQPVLPTRDDFGESVYEVTYNSQWGELNLIKNAINTADYQRLELELTEAPAAGAFSMKVYDSGHYQSVSSANTTMTFNTGTMGNTISRITLQSSAAGNKTTIKSVRLVKKDGTTVSGSISTFWGCTIEEKFVTAISPLSLPDDASANIYYDLQGRSTQHPTKGLYILNGKKVIIK
jgi:hypothetical protein